MVHQYITLTCQTLMGALKHCSSTSYINCMMANLLSHQEVNFMRGVTQEQTDAFLTQFTVL